MAFSPVRLIQKIFLEENKLQVVATGALFIIGALGGYFTPFLCICLLFNSRYWWLIGLYLLWIFLDRNSCETGSRLSLWVLKWKWWQYVHDYFSANLILVPGFHLDENKNYLLCSFPHGVIPFGFFVNIQYGLSKFRSLYPNFTYRYAVLKHVCFLPFSRELHLLLGAISASKQSLNYVLQKPGGNIVTLHPGGAKEAAYATPGLYAFVIKNRKGFIKIALENGTHLVPVITFGETDLFKQFSLPIIKFCQKIFKKYMGFIPVLMWGRGIFQNVFGLIPRKTVLTTVGRPIEVTKIENPSSEQIEELHKVFVEELVKLFEKYKSQCLKDGERVVLYLK